MDELTGSRVIIAGGGIGGAALALALARKGAHVTLFERATEFGEVGAGLQIGPHGSRILAELGVFDEVVAKGVLPRNIVFRDAITAETLTTIDLGRDFQRHYGGVYFVVHRSDLHSVLVNAAIAAGADLRTGTTVTADVVLGMDGLKSTLRRAVSDDQPVPSGYVAYRGTFPYNEVPLEEDVEDVVGYIGPGCHFIQYPLRGGAMLNQVAVFQSPKFLRGEAEWGGPDELEQAFARCHRIVRNGLSHLWKDRWWPMSDREPISNWVDGRMLLLGDAAHPPLQYLASGAVMALEDAHCVADTAARDLRGDTANWPRVLADVNAERAPRCNRILTTGRMWGELWHVDGAAREVRNELFRVNGANRKYTDWLWGYTPQRVGTAAGRW